jgi:hypothetical protein
VQTPQESPAGPLDDPAADQCRKAEQAKESDPLSLKKTAKRQGGDGADAHFAVPPLPREGD